MTYLQHEHNLNQRAVACWDAPMKMSPLSPCISSWNCGTPHSSVLSLGAKEHVKFDVFPIIYHTISLCIQEYLVVCLLLCVFQFQAKTKSSLTCKKKNSSLSLRFQTSLHRATSVNGLTEKQGKYQAFMSSRRKLPCHFCNCKYHHSPMVIEDHLKPVSH